jgi:hypothetical protein
MRARRLWIVIGALYIIVVPGAILYVFLAYRLLRWIGVFK